MFSKVQIIFQELAFKFEAIPESRKEILKKISTYIQGKKEQGLPINLVFICTHNSRRSHFGQVAAAVAAYYYGIENVRVFSGGTEATAFHSNAIQALNHLGFEVTTADQNIKNPLWLVRFGENATTTCFSKVYNHPSNPPKDFAAIMTCSDADQNCPVIFGAELRVGTTYQDPKSSDGTPLESQTYSARFLQIATEMMYVFSLIK
ncbi:MAG: hypothetical protein JNN12_14570 [Bacteroidetes Order II. Incertae sedis bacterium]|nr:hypothetical protein [Bacteroidetes Order II. bacterium]